MTAEVCAFCAAVRRPSAGYLWGDMRVCFVVRAGNAVFVLRPGCEFRAACAKDIHLAGRSVALHRLKRCWFSVQRFSRVEFNSVKLKLCICSEHHFTILITHFVQVFRLIVCHILYMALVRECADEFVGWIDARNLKQQ